MMRYWRAFWGALRLTLRGEPPPAPKQPAIVVWTRELERRMAQRGMHPRDLAGILVTHEHSDHAGGVAALARHYGIAVFASAGTATR